MRVDDLDGQDQREELLGEVLVRGRRTGAAEQRARALVGAQLDARRAQRRQRAGRNAGRDVGVHEQRLGRVADARPLRLGVDDDPQRGVEVGATRPRRRGSCPTPRRSPAPARPADSAFFSPSPPRGMIRSTTPSWPASSASSSRPPPATSDTAPVREPGLGRIAREASTAFECAARRRAAQHDRVAGLQAQRGGVDRHVRPRLVDHRDHAERHAHLADVEPVGQPAAVDHLADRVGQRGDRAHAAPAIAAIRAGVERQPVHQRAREARLAPGLEVARVGLQDLRRARLERVGDRAAARASFVAAVERRQRARRRPARRGRGR